MRKFKLYERVQINTPKEHGHGSTVTITKIHPEDSFWDYEAAGPSTDYHHWSFKEFELIELEDPEEAPKEIPTHLEKLKNLRSGIFVRPDLSDYWKGYARGLDRAIRILEADND